MIVLAASAGAAAALATSAEEGRSDASLATTASELAHARRRALFDGAPAVPESISRLSHDRSTMPTTQLRAAVHAASLAALQEADLRPLLADPRLELLLIPKGWWGFDDVLALVDGSDGMLELTGVHVAYPGEQRTTIGIIERLEGHDWPATFRGWDEFFVAGMRENLANAEELVRDPTVDGETRAADERYIHDASAALARAETGDHPVYAIRTVAGATLRAEHLAALQASLVRRDIGGFLIPRAQVPPAVVPLEDPARDRAVDAATTTVERQP